MDSPQVTVNSLIERGFIFLNDKNWQKANEYFERVLDADPHNSNAYLGLCMAWRKCERIEQLADLVEDYITDPNYVKAYDFADEAQKASLDQVHNEWQKAHDQAQAEASQKKHKRRKKGIIIAIIVAAALAILYFVGYPTLLNILITNGAISANTANYYFGFTPYTFSYVINDNNPNTTLVCQGYVKMSSVTLDTSNSATINITDSRIKSIINISDCPQFTVVIENEDNDFDLFGHISMQGFDKYILFVDEKPEYNYSVETDYNDGDYKDQGITFEQYCQNNNITPIYYLFRYCYILPEYSGELSLNRTLSADDIQNLSMLTNLSSLTLDGAAVTDFSFLGSMSNLQSLTIKNNLPQPEENTNYVYDFSSLFNLTELQELTLTGLYFGEIDLTPLKKLRTVDLSENCAHDINLSGLTELTTLSLTGNLVNNLNIDNCPNIYELNVGTWEGFSTLPDMSSIEHLSVLNLSNYLIGDLPTLRIPQKCDSLFIGMVEQYIPDSTYDYYYGEDSGLYSHASDEELAEYEKNAKIWYCDLSDLAEIYPDIESLHLYYHSDNYDSSTCTGLPGIESLSNLKAVSVIDFRIYDNDSLKESWNTYLKQLNESSDTIELAVVGSSEIDIICQLL